jgi:hypothetical protein
MRSVGHITPAVNIPVTFRCSTRAYSSRVMSASSKAAPVRNLLAVAMLAITALGLSPAIAAANGGSTIAAAPDLVLGSMVSSGWSHQVVFGSTEGEFWRVPLTGGETLTIQSSNVSGAGCGLSLDMYAPSVTDSTIGTAPTAWSQSDQITFVAPYSGTWTLLVTTGCGGSTVTYNYIAAVEPSKGEAHAGAGTIAAAPYLLLGTTISSGWSHQQVFGSTEGEFWRVPLTGGQTLTIQSSGVTGAGCGLSLDVYAPSVTDATVGTAPNAWSGSTQVTFVAPYSGTWTLLVTTGCGGSTVSYNYIAAVEAAKGEARTGAATIAAAPNLVLGSTVASGWSHQVAFGTTEGEFWRVGIAAGQTLTIQSSGVSGAGCGLSLDMYAPSVTDATVGTAQNAGSASNQITFVAPYSGTWTLLVTTGCGGSTVSYNYVASISGPAATSTSTSSGGASPTAPASLALSRHSYTVTSSGRLTVVVVCGGSVCSGTLLLTAHVKKTAGHGRHKKTKMTSMTIGAASFSGLSVGTHGISLKLNNIGLRLLERDHDRLSATAQVTYTSGSATKTYATGVSLKGARVKKTVR